MSPHRDRLLDNFKGSVFDFFYTTSQSQFIVAFKNKLINFRFLQADAPERLPERIQLDFLSHMRCSDSIKIPYAYVKLLYFLHAKLFWYWGRDQVLNRNFLSKRLFLKEGYWYVYVPYYIIRVLPWYSQDNTNINKTDYTEKGILIN